MFSLSKHLRDVRMDDEPKGGWCEVVVGGGRVRQETKKGKLHLYYLSWVSVKVIPGEEFTDSPMEPPNTYSFTLRTSGPQEKAGPGGGGVST